VRPNIASLYKLLLVFPRSRRLTGARLTTERGMYFISDSDWNLYTAIISLLDTIERKVRRKRVWRACSETNG
jgi:ribosome-associated translation inhibitor RaiA